MGAWIETPYPLRITNRHKVAPYMGAWIETTDLPIPEFDSIGRTLHGCVD